MWHLLPPCKYYLTSGNSGRVGTETELSDGASSGGERELPSFYRARSKVARLVNNLCIPIFKKKKKKNLYIPYDPNAMDNLLEASIHIFQKPELGFGAILTFVQF